MYFSFPTTKDVTSKELLLVGAGASTFTRSHSSRLRATLASQQARTNCCRLSSNNVSRVGSPREVRMRGTADSTGMMQLGHRSRKSSSKLKSCNDKTHLECWPRNVTGANSDSALLADQQLFSASVLFFLAGFFQKTNCPPPPGGKLYPWQQNRKP